MGRVQELEDLHRLLQTSDHVAIVAATGMGGIGKTQLAWHYLAQNCDSYPAGIWWLRAGQLVSQVFEFGRRMGWEPSPSPAVSEVDQVQGIWQYWLRLLPRRARLVVVDDVTNYRELKHFLPADGQFRVVLTTRKRLGSPVQLLEVPVLRLELALELFRRLGVAPERLAVEPEAAAALCGWVGGLPLGLELVGRFLAGRPSLGIGELLQRLEAEKLAARAMCQVLEEMPYEHNLRAAFELSWQALSEGAQTVAGLLSLLAVAPVTAELLRACLPDWNAEDLEEVLSQELVRGSLLDELEPGRYQVHRLLHHFFAEKLATELEPKAAGIQRGFATALTTVAKTIPQTVTLSVLARVETALPHLERVAAWVHLLSDADKTWSVTSLARVAASQSRWYDAETWYQRSLHIMETQLGADHPDTASSLGNLAQLYTQLGRYTEAEPYLLQALQIFQQAVGSDHPYTTETIRRLTTLIQQAIQQGQAATLSPHPTTQALLREIQHGE